MKLSVLVLGLVQLVSLPSANAWRETGHFTVCEIAYRHLNSRAKSKVDQVAGVGFAAQCTWPDMIRKHPDYSYTSSWHFLDRNAETDFLAEAKLRGGKFLAGDVLQALVKVSQTLKHANSTADEKKFALRFLGHLVGDIHQPLHIGQEEDGGGNKIQVEWFGQSGYKYSEIQKYEDKLKGTGEVFTDESTGEKVVKSTDEKSSSISLHKIWDLHLLEKFIELSSITPGQGYDQYSYKQYASKIDQGQADAETIKFLQNSTFYDWYLESKYFRSFAYNTGDLKLGASYYEKVIELANFRMLVGGLRLAGELNRIWGGAAVPALLRKDQKLLEEMIAEAQVISKKVQDSTVKTEVSAKKIKDDAHGQVIPSETLIKFSSGEKQLKLGWLVKQLCSEKSLQALYSKKEKSGRKPASFYEDYKAHQREQYQKLAGKEFSQSQCR
jgi:hypothetical protein